MRRRRRGSSLVEALVAAALLAVVGLLVTEAIAAAANAGTRAQAGAQARRLLEQDLEQARSGMGVPSGGTSGPFTVAVATQAASFGSVITPPNTPSCGGCAGGIVTSGVGSLTQVTVTVTMTADGAVLARGATVTPH
jgi:type II secretory pathway pseudopilin PulG